MNHRYTGANPCILTIRSTSFPVPQNSVDSKSNEAPISQVDLSTFDEGVFFCFWCIVIFFFWKIEEDMHFVLSYLLTVDPVCMPKEQWFNNITYDCPQSFTSI